MVCKTVKYAVVVDFYVHVIIIWEHGRGLVVTLKRTMVVAFRLVDYQLKLYVVI